MCARRVCVCVCDVLCLLLAANDGKDEVTAHIKQQAAKAWMDKWAIFDDGFIMAPGTCLASTNAI